MRRKASLLVALIGFATLLFGAMPASAAETKAAGPQDVVISEQFVVRAGPNWTQLPTACAVTIRAQFPSSGTQLPITYSGTTSCNQVLYQAGQAALLTDTRAVQQYANPFGYAYLYGGVSRSMYAPVTKGAGQILHYDTVLYAPAGQVWRQAPSGCRGVFTSRLICTFERAFVA